MAWAGDTALSQIRKADKERERERGGKGGKGERSAVFGHFRGEFVCLFDPFCMRLGTAQFGLELGRNLLNASLSRSLWLPLTTSPTPSPNASCTSSQQNFTNNCKMQCIKPAA